MGKPNAREVKKINVSENRQITIPKRFYEKIGMGRDVICELHGDELILRPVPKEGSFSEEIIKELVAEGYNGQELLQEFRNRKAQIRPAVEKMIAESSQEAQRFSGTNVDETTEIFGEE